MPAGADAVVMVEETDTGEDDQVRIFTPVYPRQHVGRRGADITTGQTLVTRGDHLTPSRIGALAAIGVADIEVFARPQIALLSTGDEIVEPGQPLAPGQIYDINRFTLQAIIDAHGGTPISHPTTGDTLDALSAAVDACMVHDMLVFSGGSSVGERDLILDVLQQKGDVVFHGIAVKPGKPTVFGRIGRETGPRHAGLSDLLPFERLHAAHPDAAAPRPPATTPAADGVAADGGSRRLDDRQTPVLHRAHRA